MNVSLQTKPRGADIPALFLKSTCLVFPAPFLPATTIFIFSAAPFFLVFLLEITLGMLSLTPLVPTPISANVPPLSQLAWLTLKSPSFHPPENGFTTLFGMNGL